MRILFLAPHPFYQERGTPIDVLLMLRVLSARPDTSVDVITFHEGSDVILDNVNFERIRAPRFAKGVRPGFSLKKLLCDFLLFLLAWRKVRHGDYDFVHADEEAVFFAMFFKWRYRIPYAYDLDSSIAQQLVESRPFLSPLSYVFSRLEAAAIRGALINFPVCLELGKLCQEVGAQATVVVHDISQIDKWEAAENSKLKAELKVTGLLLLYAGNFEAYQGLDLLIESMALAVKNCANLYLAVIGGEPSDIDTYTSRCATLGLLAHVFFLGKKPVTKLGEYLIGSDILVSPRIRGINTPMKIFPYLHSGRPLIATDITTHNQILTNEEALLVPPTAQGMAEGIVRLARDPDLRKRLGEKGRALVERNHTFESHKQRVNLAYDSIEESLGLRKSELSDPRRESDGIIMLPAANSDQDL